VQYLAHAVGDKEKLAWKEKKLRDGLIRTTGKISSGSGIVLIITGCLTQPYRTFILTARWCDIVLNVQAIGQGVTKIQKDYHRKRIVSL